MREVTFEIGVGVKVRIEIRADQEGAVSDSHEGVVDICFWGECGFDIYIRCIDSVFMYGQFRLKVVRDTSARMPAPEIARDGASPGLNSKGFVSKAE